VYALLPQRQLLNIDTVILSSYLAAKADASSPVRFYEITNTRYAVLFSLHFRYPRVVLPASLLLPDVQNFGMKIILSASSTMVLLAIDVVTAVAPSSTV